MAVNESDVRFNYKKNGYLRQITLSTNKIIEMRENGLLDPNKVQKYSRIMVIHDKKKLPIPIVIGSGRYCGQKEGQLRFSVSPIVRLKKGELHNWHLYLSEGQK